MAQNLWGAPRPQPQPPLQPQPQPASGYRGRRWLRTLLIGIVLFIIAAIVLVWSGNPNLFPTVILIGNFLVPVVFVAFLYDHQHTCIHFGMGCQLPCTSAFRPAFLSH